MRNNQAAGSVPNSTAGPLPIAFCAERIPLTAGPNIVPKLLSHNELSKLRGRNWDAEMRFSADLRGRCTA